MANMIRGMAAGLLAGCAASWVMQAFAQMEPVHPRPRQKGGSNGGESEGAASRPREAIKQEGQHEDATVKTAEMVSRKLFEHELTDEEKQIAGPVVHYAYGSLMGALYGGLAEVMPGLGAGMGLPYGFALWVLGDEVAVPALGLSKGPGEYPVDVHADALASHLMYGATTDVLRRVLRHVI